MGIFLIFHYFNDFLIHLENSLNHIAEYSSHFCFLALYLLLENNHFLLIIPLSQESRLNC